MRMYSTNEGKYFSLRGIPQTLWDKMERYNQEIQKEFPYQNVSMNSSTLHALHEFFKGRDKK